MEGEKAQKTVHNVEGNEEMAERTMIDTHMHIIPGVDDGSLNLDMSKSMLLMAYIQGIRAVFATPHSTAFVLHGRQVQEQFLALKHTVQALPFPLQMPLFLGCEVRCEREQMAGTLELLQNGIFPSMNGTRYVLTEFRTSVSFQDARDITTWLRQEGWRPVLAHVERYPALFEEGGIEQLCQDGCFFQINACSLADEPDHQIMLRARRLLAEGKVSFLGSDAHRLNHRPPSVERGLHYLYDHCAKDYADAVAFLNAEKLFQMGPVVSKDT